MLIGALKVQTGAYFVPWTGYLYLQGNMVWIQMSLIVILLFMNGGIILRTIYLAQTVWGKPWDGRYKGYKFGFWRRLCYRHLPQWFLSLMRPIQIPYGGQELSGGSQWMLKKVIIAPIITRLVLRGVCSTNGIRYRRCWSE